MRGFLILKVNDIFYCRDGPDRDFSGYLTKITVEYRISVFFMNHICKEEVWTNYGGSGHTIM